MCTIRVVTIGESFKKGERQMRRREFLERMTLSVPASAGALASHAPPQTTPQAVASSGAWPLPLGVGYFTEEKLQALIDTSTSLSGKKFQTVCFNFPNYHPSPAQERYFGKGWTEYQVLRRAKPVFPGHLQPKVPLWGYYDEADVNWAERDIETAATAGIDAFMVDWFWYHGTQLLQEQLEQGFLKARNREKLKFSIMWANTNWKNQYPPNQDGPSALIYDQTYSESDMYAMADYWIEHYFSQPNYLKVGEQPIVGLLFLEHLVKSLGGAERTRRILDNMRSRSARSAAGGIHFTAMELHTPELVHGSGVDSVTHYHTYYEEFGAGHKLQVRKWVEAAESTIKRWKTEADSYRVPYFPDCAVGWDNSARFGDQTCIFVERSPDQYERLLRAAKYFSAERKTDPPLIFLSTWNEWTEDHYLLPDVQFGYSYLEAVQRQFGSKKHLMA